MHKQPHATFFIPSACAFGRTQPRVTPYCFYARSTPPRMRASLALPCSSLSDRRHATPQFFHPSIDTIPKKNARHFLHPPFICAFSRPQPRVAACWFCTCSTPPSPFLHGLCMFQPSQPTDSHLPLLLLLSCTPRSCGVFCPSPFHHRRHADFV